MTNYTTTHYILHKTFDLKKKKTKFVLKKRTVKFRNQTGLL